MPELVFWLAIGAMAYTWVGYPLVLTLAAALMPPPARRRPGPTPRLSVVIAAFNEAHCIGAKIAGTLAQRYPGDRLEVVVVSDGSTDGTDEIVGGHPDPRVSLIRQTPRAGKSAALNRGVAGATGDVLVFTDANALFVPGALARLAAPFTDPRVGLVSGQGLYGAAGGGDARAVSNGYVRYEARLKRGEGRLGFLASADGAVYALRRELYRPLDAAEVNDLLHPIQTALAGFVCRFAARACTIEPPSRDARQEFRRHVRIIAQGMHLCARWLPRLIAARRGRAVWALLSHRVLRWGTGVFLAAALAASAVLAPGSLLYGGALAAQVVFYGVGLAGFIAERRGRSLGRLAVPYYFCVVAAAGGAGFVRYLRGGADATWAPRGRAPTAVRDRAA